MKYAIMSCEPVYKPVMLEIAPYSRTPFFNPSVYSADAISNYKDSNNIQYQVINFDSSSDILSKYLETKNDCSLYLAEREAYKLNSLEKAKLVFNYVQERVYKDNYSSSNSTLEDLLVSGKGNCLSTTALVYLLIKELVSESSDFKIDIVTPKGHIACLINYMGDEYFVENTTKYGFGVETADTFTKHSDGLSAILAALYNNKAASTKSLDESILLYEKALTFNASLREVHLNLSKIYAFKKNYSLSELHLNAVHEISSRDTSLKTKSRKLSVSFYEKTTRLDSLDLTVIADVPKLYAAMPFLDNKIKYYYKRKKKPISCLA